MDINGTHRYLNNNLQACKYIIYNYINNAMLHIADKNIDNNSIQIFLGLYKKHN
jgi:hypothetical protein